MTNKEILQASLLDILFDNRNKDYGAYSLRNGYSRRLLTAICSALTAAFLVFMMLSFNKNKFSEPRPVSENDSVVIHQVELPRDKPQKQQTQKAISKPMPKIASTNSVSKIVITDDFKVKNRVPEISELKNTIISNINSPVIPSIGNVREAETTSTGTENSGTKKIDSDFKADERAPEFPGGQEALTRFLRNNLITPDELQAGETKKVYVRFLVGSDGQVSGFEITQSGGVEFDREVIRVCKKMPKWKPAFQNGSNVSVRFVLPVTFIGIEQ